MKQVPNNSNISFELFNGVSTVLFHNGEITLNFIFKNIYVIILLLIDEKPNKKLYYNEIIEKVKPTGRMREKAYL